MKKTSYVLTFVLLTSATVIAQTKWSVDPAHSKLGFTVTHMSMSEVDGDFKKFDATITSSKPDFSDAVFEMTADVASINTENDMRDGDLKSEHWFDAAKYPTLTFKSTSITKVNAKNYKLKGNMTIHGVTKPVALDLTLNGVGKDARTQKPKAGFKVTGAINRTNFGVGQAPGAMISEEILLRANGEFAQN